MLPFQGPLILSLLPSVLPILSPGFAGLAEAAAPLEVFTAVRAAKDNA